MLLDSKHPEALLLPALLRHTNANTTVPDSLSTMNIVLETNIQSISTGTIRDYPIGPDVYQPLSMEKILVHKSRYVYKRLGPSNDNTKPAIELYNGRATPHIQEISIIGEGGTLTAIYEKADEVVDHRRLRRELPFATVVQFTQTIKYVPPSDINSSQPPTTLSEAARQASLVDNANYTPGSSSSTPSAIEVDQTSAQALQVVPVTSRPKRRLPLRIHSKTGMRGSRRKNITSCDESCSKSKRRRDDDDDYNTSLNKDVSAKSKRRRLVMLGASILGVSFEFGSVQWDIAC